LSSIDEYNGICPTYPKDKEPFIISQEGKINILDKNTREWSSVIELSWLQPKKCSWLRSEAQPGRPP